MASGRTTVPLLAKPGIFLSILITGILCTTPLHCGIFYLCSILWVLWVFFKVPFFLQQKIYSASQYNTVIPCRDRWLLGNFSLILCQDRCCPVISKQWHQKMWAFCICCWGFDGIDPWHFVPFRFWQWPVVNWDEDWACRWRIVLNLCPGRLAPGLCEEMWLMALPALLGKALACLFFSPGLHRYCLHFKFAMSLYIILK